MEMGFMGDVIERDWFADTHSPWKDGVQSWRQEQDPGYHSDMAFGFKKQSILGIHQWYLSITSSWRPCFSSCGSGGGFHSVRDCCGNVGSCKGTCEKKKGLTWYNVATRMDRFRCMWTLPNRFHYDKSKGMDGSIMVGYNGINIDVCVFLFENSIIVANVARHSVKIVQQRTCLYPILALMKRSACAMDATLSLSLPRWPRRMHFLHFQDYALPHHNNLHHHKVRVDKSAEMHKMRLLMKIWRRLLKCHWKRLSNTSRAMVPDTRLLSHPSQRVPTLQQQHR